MNVLIVLPSLSYRGVERYVHILTRGLVKKGHQAQILTGRIEKDALKIDPKIKLISPPKLINGLIQNNLVYFILSFPIIFLLMLKNCKGADVIETEGGFSLWASVIVGKLRGAKVVWSVHICKEESSGHLARKLLFLPLNLLDNFFAKRVDCVKTISLENARCLKKIFGFRDIKILLPPVDFSRLKNPKPKRVIKKHKLNGKIVLLLAATLHKLKNQEVAINSLSHVLKEFPNCLLVLVGEGKDKDRLKKQVEQKGLEKNVIFAGVAKNEEIAGYYKACDLVLVPSYISEGMPIVPFEALYLGLISIVARGSGADKVLEKEGIGLVASPSANEFSSAILNYLRQPHKFEKLKDKGALWVRKNLNPDKFILKNIKIYKSLV